MMSRKSSFIRCEALPNGTRILCLVLSFGICISPLACDKSDPLRLPMVEGEDEPCVATLTHCLPDSLNQCSFEILVWANGKIVWSEEPFNPEQTFLEGHVDPTLVFLALEAIRIVEGRPNRFMSESQIRIHGGYSMMKIQHRGYKLFGASSEQVYGNECSPNTICERFSVARDILLRLIPPDGGVPFELEFR